MLKMSKKNNMAENRKKIIAVIQGRIGSTRLPKKVLINIAGKTPIEWIKYRLSFAKEINGAILAAADNIENNPVAELGEKLGLPVFRGSELDLVGRLLRAAKKFEADAIVRITADCPLVDPEIVDLLATEYRCNPDADLITNVFPPTFPDGLDVEIISRRALLRLDKEVKDPLKREWITANMMDNPEKFKIVNIKNAGDLSSLRLTLDYPEDLELISLVFTKLHKSGTIFGLGDIIELFKREPSAAEINAVRKDLKIVDGIRSGAYHEAKKNEKSRQKIE